MPSSAHPPATIPEEDEAGNYEKALRVHLGATEADKVSADMSIDMSADMSIEQVLCARPGGRSCGFGGGKNQHRACAH